MTDKVNLLMKYSCNICNKEYASQSSLCNHNKKFHQNKITNVKNVKEIVKNVNENVKIVKSLTCEYCNKIFNNRPAKSIHKKYCSIKKPSELDKEIENKKLELELKKEEIILKKEEAKILQLKLKLQQADKVDNITLNKLNKMLLKHNNRIKNSTINSHNNSNNTINVQNNFQLVGFGKEEITELLTNNEKKTNY
jgi:hypothetical protein